jgi:hypothetical protein
MSLTLLTSPNTYSFTRNPIPIEVEGGTGWQSPTAGVNTKYRLNFPASTSDGDSFQISFAGFALTFTFETSLTDDSGLYILKAASVTALYIAYVRTTMLQNMTLSDYVAITVVSTPDGITIEAPFEAQLVVFNGIFGTLTLIDEGSAAVYPSNYTLRLKLLQANGTFITSLTGKPTIDSPYNCPFDVANILDSLLSATLPTYNYGDVLDCTSNIKEIGYEYAEGWDIPTLYRFRNIGTNFFAVKGGLQFPDAPGANYLDTANALIALMQSGEKMTSAAAHEFAYILSTSFTGQIKLRFIVRKTDGTGANYDTALFTNALAPEKVFAFPCNLQMIGISTELVSSYKVEIRDSSGSRILTLPVTYINDLCPVVEHHILYENSFGGFTTLCCNRYKVEGVEVAKNTATSYLNFDYSARDSSTYTYRSVGTRKMQLATRFLPLEEIKNLAQLFTAKSVYFQDNDLQEYVPISIDTDSISLYQEGSDLYQLSFEIAYLYDFGQN